MQRIFKSCEALPYNVCKRLENRPLQEVKCNTSLISSMSAGSAKDYSDERLQYGWSHQTRKSKFGICAKLERSEREKASAERHDGKVFRLFGGLFFTFHFSKINLSKMDLNEKIYKNTTFLKLISEI